MIFSNDESSILWGQFYSLQINIYFASGNPSMPFFFSNKTLGRPDHSGHTGLRHHLAGRSYAVVGPPSEMFVGLWGHI